MPYTNETCCNNPSPTPPPTYATISIHDVYPKGYEVPEGYAIDGFRKVQVGEVFIAADKCSKATTIKSVSRIATVVSSLPTYPRLILKPCCVAPKDCSPARPSKAPAGYEFTGEYRKAEYGEWYTDKDLNGPYQWLNVFSPHTISKFWLLRPVATPPPTPTPESVYGTKTPTPPKGWYLGEFRKVKAGEKVLTSFLGFGLQGLAHTAVHNDISPDYYRYILHLIPTLHTIYGTYNPIIPEGYESTGEVARPEKGQDYLGLGLNSFNSGGMLLPCHDGFRLILRKLPPPPPSPRRWTIEVEENHNASDLRLDIGVGQANFAALSILTLTEHKSGAK